MGQSLNPDAYAAALSRGLYPYMSPFSELIQMRDRAALSPAEPPLEPLAASVALGSPSPLPINAGSLSPSHPPPPITISSPALISYRPLFAPSSAIAPAPIFAAILALATPISESLARNAVLLTPGSFGSGLLPPHPGLRPC